MPEKEVGAIAALLGAIVGIVWWFAVKTKTPLPEPPSPKESRQLALVALAIDVLGVLFTKHK